jgi:hypothetical protein
MDLFIEHAPAIAQDLSAPGDCFEWVKAVGNYLLSFPRDTWPWPDHLNSGYALIAGMIDAMPNEEMVLALIELCLKIINCYDFLGPVIKASHELVPDLLAKAQNKLSSPARAQLIGFIARTLNPKLQRTLADRLAVFPESHSENRLKNAT